MTHVTLHFPGASQPVIPYIIRLAFSLTAVLLCAFGAVNVARRASAAVRHRIWSLGVAACLVLPAALALVPERRVGLVASELSTQHAPTVGEQSLPDASIDRDVIATDAPLPVASTVPPHADPTSVPLRTFPTAIVLLIAYAVPAFLLIARLLLGAMRSRSAVRRATPLHLHTDTTVPVFESLQTQSPVCVGYFKPSILLPPSWRKWPADQLRAVLTHELAHVARRDVLWQGLASLACAVYWPHPLTWYAARRMRIEREFACDDSVLRAGATPTLYSRWLLDLATNLRAPNLGVAMSNRSGLAARVQAALNPTRQRAPLSRLFSLASLFTTVAILFFFAVLSPLQAAQIQSPPTSASPPTPPAAFRPQDRSIRFVAGRVTDSTGKPVPAARIFVLLSGRSFSLHNATADADGHFVLFIDLRLPQPLHLRAESPDGTDVGSLDLPRTGRLTQADLENLCIALKPAIPYPVIVTDANDRPINRVTVTAMLGPGNPIETSTDAAGKATLLLPADNPPTSIIVSKPDVGLDYFVFPRRGARAAREPVSPAPGEPIHFALNGARTVTVKVTDFLLRPLAGVNVHPRTISKPGKSPLIISANAPDSAVTDASGTAKLTVPADVDRPVTFATSFPGYVLSYNPTWDPAAPENWVTLEMKPMTRYHLAVLDPDGKPAPSADAMMVDDHGAQNYGNFQNGPVGADGKVDGFLLPDTVYMFAAMKGKLASDPVIQVVRVGAPPVRVELKLKPAVRVHGKLTAGTPPVPVANGNIYIQFDDADAYQSLPPAQRLPAGVTGPRDIHPAVMFNRPTDSEGNFEFYLAPGTYHLIDPLDLRQVVPASTTFVVPSNQPDITFDFHHKSQRPVPRQ